MAELKGVFKDAFTFAQQYSYIISSNGVANSFRTPISEICEELVRIYDIEDACDYIKHFTLDGGRKMIFMFTKNQGECYQAIRHDDCIFIVLPTHDVFKNIDDISVMEGILNVLHTVLNFADVMKYGSPTEIFRIIFASYYFMALTFCSCYEMDANIKKTIISVINDEFGDIVNAEDVIKALTSVKEDKVAEFAANLFTNHKVLSYMTHEGLKILVNK
jgi:hypothetical protein